MSLGTGLNKIKTGIPVGHIGHFNDLMLMGTLSASNGSRSAKVPHRGGGCWRRWKSEGRDIVPCLRAVA
jgi:alanine-glyoxylate transaminase/serine-glyoxylate transaminase/serine-pyruvate transaminase